MDTVAEPLITFIVVGFLITSATIIAYESILNIRIAHDLNLGLFLFWGNNYLKEYSFRLVMRRSVETNSSSLKADGIGVMQLLLLQLLLEFLWLYC
jgi:divalent metal cation (Fe/Co/Zn/Cd) transporter